MGFTVLQQATLRLRQLGGHTFLNEGKQCRHQPHPLLDSPKTDLLHIWVTDRGPVFMLLPEEHQSTVTSQSSFGELSGLIPSFRIKANCKSKFKSGIWWLVEPLEGRMMQVYSSIHLKTRGHTMTCRDFYNSPCFLWPLSSALKQGPWEKLDNNIHSHYCHGTIQHQLQDTNS